VDEISTGLAFVLGTCGLPHIMMRFLTVPDARQARRSVGWAVGLIGIFYLFVAIIGLGGRAILGDAGVKLGGKSGNLIAPFLAQRLGGGPGSAGGRHLLRGDHRGGVHDDPRRRLRCRPGRPRERPPTTSTDR
jgi:cation/acetate symporter